MLIFVTCYVSYCNKTASIGFLNKRGGYLEVGSIKGLEPNWTFAMKNGYPNKLNS